jgi:hypothetical protein
MHAIPWMAAGPFGVMVHYTRGTMPRAGAWEADWDRACDAFDVPRFADQVADAGARWAIFPFGHIAGGGYYCSPNAYLESRVPGRCSRRDLMTEIADALAARDVRLIAYLHTEVDCGGFDPALRDGLEWDDHPTDKRRFQHHWQSVIAEWSTRLGTRCAGWWFDGCYVAADKPFLRTRAWDNSRFDFPAWDAAVRAGNPNAIYAMNPGANSFACVNPTYEGYLGGEANDLTYRPTCPRDDGLPLHALVWIDCFWVHEKQPGEIEPPKYAAQALADYVRAWQRFGGGVTFNVGIYQDGLIAPPSVDRLREAARLIAGAGTSQG